MTTEPVTVGSDNLEELFAQASKPWYRYGRRSPGTLYARLRNRYRPIFRLKMAWQRARHGYSDDQYWSLNYAVAEMMVKGTQRMRQWANGYPAEFADKNDPVFAGTGEGWEAWEKILIKIEEGFQAWIDSDGWFKDPEEEAKFNEGMQLFVKWYGSLWD